MSYSKYVEAWNNKHRDNRIDISKDWFYGDNVEDLLGLNLFKRSKDRSSKEFKAHLEKYINSPLIKYFL